MSAASEDWKKLTVAKLKALCKDKKITGYSKLGKNAIIQKLVEHVGNSGNAVGSGVVPTEATSTSAVVASSQLRIPVTSGTTDLAPLPLEQDNIDQNQILPDDQPQKSSPRELTKTSINNNSPGGNRHLYSSSNKQN